jgi:hypothetical protein
VEYTYDNAGNCVRMKYADSSMAYIYEYGYDSNGCLISEKRFLADGVTLDATTTYEYKSFDGCFGSMMVFGSSTLDSSHSDNGKFGLYK